MAKVNPDSASILESSVQYIKNVGPKRAESFYKIGIKTIRDMLFYFPYKHLDRSSTVTIAKLYEYVMEGYDGEVTIIATVKSIEKRRLGGRRELLKVHFADETGFIDCVWFQGVKYFEGVFEEGELFAVSGKPQISQYDNLQFTHPDFDKISDDESVSYLNTGKIIPIYSSSKELKATNIGELSLRRIVSYAVEKYAYLLEETLPEYLLKEFKLMPLKDAVRNFHFPENMDKLHDAVRRMKFEELLYIELLVALRYKNYKTELKGISMKVKSGLVSAFLKTLPYELTKAQLKVLSEIRKDMEAEKPMNRLLQGDVGSGKTIVALIAMLIAVDNGHQAVLMAPTEILAAQHAKNISNMMNKLAEVFPEKKIKVSLLLGGQKKSEKDKTLEEIELQEADIIIGTHALFEEKVKFKDLKLIIVDEQHRFGVQQRGRLQQKGVTPDIIVMSATPIPRTLTMTLYGDLDVSIIDEMPKNRIPIQTALRGESKLPEIYKFIADKSKEGVQSFIVYPLVEESEKLELKSAEKYYDDLTNTYLKDLNVGLIHGRMSWKQKEEVMYQFLNKMYDVLIATTVIEVGIDIPSANIMVINDAHRFGLSQLHQLRGRIGRGKEESFCILVTRDELLKYRMKNFNIDFVNQAKIEKYKSSIRLQSMAKYTDGFKLAEIDLKLRGPGNIFGTQQSGFPDLKYADITKDAEILISAKNKAFEIIGKDKSLSLPDNKIFKENLHKYYAASLNYANIA
ncbi:MAG TPA: ATP-dependent DNA helicase RecG [Ignavibacteriaceae bacterium]|nr:ATP-dependent DNA helicase RecG [Ignavibacteriaceae bacterium]